MCCGTGDILQVQEAIQAFQGLLDYKETQEKKEIVVPLVFLDSLMVTTHVSTAKLCSEL